MNGVVEVVVCFFVVLVEVLGVLIKLLLFMLFMLFYELFILLLLWIIFGVRKVLVIVEGFGEVVCDVFGVGFFMVCLWRFDVDVVVRWVVVVLGD